jgi:hypothetical protein
MDSPTSAVSSAASVPSRTDSPVMRRSNVFVHTSNGMESVCHRDGCTSQLFASSQFRHRYGWFSLDSLHQIEGFQYSGPAPLDNQDDRAL